MELEYEAMPTAPVQLMKAYEFLSINTYKVRRRLRHEVPVWLKRIVLGAAATAAVASVALVIWRGPDWFDSDLIDSIRDPEKRAQAVTSSRTTLLQIALAIGGLATIIFTARAICLPVLGRSRTVTQKRRRN